MAIICKDECIMMTLSKTLTPKLMALTLIGILALSGCSVFRVYTIDLPQGTPITSAQAAQVQVGMSADQVMYLLGSPAMKDTLNPNRFDYLYDYTAGTHAFLDEHWIWICVVP